MTDALLVGSRRSWRDKLDPILADYGIRVRWWWETRSDTGSIPTGCDVVLITTDCNAHTVSEPAIRRAREAKIPVHTIVHRKAALVPMLEKAGFTQRKEASMSTRLVRPMSPPPPLPATLTPPAIPPTKPTFHHSNRFAWLTPTEQALYIGLLRDLAADPWLTATMLLERHKDQKGAAKATIQRTALAARDTLGILAAQGSGAARITDRLRYETTCAALSIQPVKADIGPMRPWSPPAKRQSAPTVKAAKPEAPVEAPKPEAPVAPPTPQAPALSDVRVAVALLREAMAREGVETVTITPTGTTLTRRVVITESIE